MTDFYKGANGEPLKVNLASWSLTDKDEAQRLADAHLARMLEHVWGDPPLPPPAERNMVIRYVSIKALGVEWWTDQTTFKARVTMSNESEADVRPLTGAVVERAEWWRRLGFYVIARPYDWLAEHTWRPWARWIVRDDVDDFDDE